MAIVQAACNSFKQELFEGLHQPEDEYRIALYTSEADLDADTTTYTTVGEVVGDGYTAGGEVLQGYTPGYASGVAWVDWTTDPTWAESSITARGAVIYNATRGNAAVAVLDFGEDVTSTNDTFTVTLPVPGAATAIVRIT